MNSTNNSIAKAMLVYSPCPTFRKKSRQPDFKGWELPEATIRFLKREPNAFLFGAIFDRMVPYEKAWNTPRLLRDRLGHLDVSRISRMPVVDLAKMIGHSSSQIALVRFPNTMSRCIISASKRLVSKYRGDASNIWEKPPEVSSVLRKLQEFEGISQKIANMTVRLLVTYYGVALKGSNNIDVAVDRHVARVFLRSGLVSPSSAGHMQRIASMRESIIERARELVPKYPGALDDPAFEIGRDWCTAEEAYCDYPGEPCPLSKVCRKLTRFGVH